MVLKWPHASHPQAVVEPGMLADQPTKVMAPSAALAMVPPREEANVAAERPQVRETRGDEVQEVLSFKERQGDRIPAGGLRPRPLPRSAHLSLWRNRPSQWPIRRLRLGRRLRPVPSAPSPVSSVADAQPDESRVGPASRSGSRRCPAGRPSAYPGSSGAWSWRGGEDRVAPWRARGGDKGTVERDGDARRCR